MTRITLGWDIVSRFVRPLFVLVLFLMGGSAFGASKVYQKPSEFVKSALGSVPKTQAIRLTAHQQRAVKAILGKNYKTRSVRHWTKGDKTAFILEEIGKTEYITTGFVVKKGQIESVKVLVYRESHGGEVARKSFTNQLRKTSLQRNRRISRKPRNIAGATLSVRAMTKLARLALYLDGEK